MSRGHSRSKIDPVTSYFVLAVASSLLLLTLAYFFVLARASALTLKFGFGFVFGSVWNPVANVFGILPMLYGSFMTAAIALIIGVPISIGAALFLSELSPHKLRSPLSFVVEMLAAVPSVVYGLWGIFVLAPVLSRDVYPSLQKYLGFLPIFKGYIYNVSVLSAGILLAIMIIPIVTAISRDAFLAIPDSQREAAYALGATKSEMTRMAVLSNARSGVVAAVFLGFGRAFGETMAVIMIIGNANVISSSLFSPGYTLAGLIALLYSEAFSPTFTSAVAEAGLVILTVSILTTVIARVFIGRLFKSREAASYL